MDGSYEQKDTLSRVAPSPSLRDRRRFGHLLSQGRCEKIGRASLLASHRPSKSLPHEARREPRPPGSSDGRFERLTIPSLHPCRRYLTQWSAAHDLSSESLTGLRSFAERSAAKTTRWLSNAISKLVKGIASPLRRLSTKAWNCGW